MNNPAALIGFRRISLAHIDSVVAGRLGPARVRGNAQPAVFSRQVAMYLAKHIGCWSTTQIGRFYNGRDHSTVCHSIRKIEKLRDTDERVAALLDLLTFRLTQTTDSAGQNVPTTLATKSTPASARAAWMEELADAIVERLLVKGLLRRTSECDAARYSSAWDSIHNANFTHQPDVDPAGIQEETFLNQIGSSVTFEK
jgi:hypothetical protein